MQYYIEIKVRIDMPLYIIQVFYFFLHMKAVLNWEHPGLQVITSNSSPIVPPGYSPQNSNPPCALAVLECSSRRICRCHAVGLAVEGLESWAFLQCWKRKGREKENE